MRGWRDAVGFAASLVLIVIVALLGWALGSLPAPKESKRVAGLAVPADILFDPDGVPYIYAQDAESAAFALGYVHARDRMWQMDLQRRLAQGRLSEIFGRRALTVDRQYRTLGIYDAAQASIAALDPDVVRRLEAYATGVNAWIAEHDGALPVEYLVTNFRPAQWTVADSVVWTKLMALRLSGNYQSELLRAALARSLPPERIEELWAPYPDTAPVTIENGSSASLAPRTRERSRRDIALATLPPLDLAEQRGASNAWVLDGSKTRTGKPILANDPHLGFAAPIVWYLAKIETPGGIVAGATAPGIPYVVIGHNDRIAWGLTATQSDLQDAILERIAADDPNRYDTPEGSEAFDERTETINVRGEEPEQLTIRRTRHGPVILGDPIPQQDDRSAVVALQATFLATDDTSIEALHRINAARDLTQFDAALEKIVAPQINVTYADTDGTIGFAAPGRMPIRRGGDGFYVRSGWDREDDWTGFVPTNDLPRERNPARGIIVNANNRIVGDTYEYFISRDWDAPYRAERILQMLGEKKGKHELQDSVRMQFDSVSLAARTLLPLMTGFEPAAPMGRRILAQLRTWDGRMERDSGEPLIFMAWLRKFVRAIYEDELGENAPSFWSLRPLFVERVLTSDAGAYWCDDKRTPVMETCVALLESSLMAALSDLEARYGSPGASKWRWGDAHRARFDHALFHAIPGLREIADLWIETDGGEFTVNRGSMRIANEDDPFAHMHGAGFRGVFDLSNLDNSRFVVATGQSGHILSPHYRSMMWLWRDGGFVVLDRSRADLQRAARLRIALTPK